MTNQLSIELLQKQITKLHKSVEDQVAYKSGQIQDQKVKDVALGLEQLKIDLTETLTIFQNEIIDNAIGVLSKKESSLSQTSIDFNLAINNYLNIIYFEQDYFLNSLAKFSLDIPNGARNLSSYVMKTHFTPIFEICNFSRDEAMIERYFQHIAVIVKTYMIEEELFQQFYSYCLDDFIETEKKYTNSPQKYSLQLKLIAACKKGIKILD